MAAGGPDQGCHKAWPRLDHPSQRQAAEATAQWTDDMSFRSDNAPLQFERANYDTGCNLTVSIVVDGEQYRQMVRINDEDAPDLIGDKLIALGNWVKAVTPKLSR